MSPLRAGLVGAGFIGSVHARSIRAVGAELAGVAGSTPDRSRAAADRLGAPRAYADGFDLVTADEIDVVHIATPNAEHAELALAALEAGKHVVCEKPLATSLADAERLVTEAAARGLVGAVPFVNRFHPMAREARSRLADGGLGSVRTIHGSYLQDWLAGPDDTNWRVDPSRGGSSRAFADIGSHWCDLAEWLTGDRIVELVATTSTVVADRPLAARETFSAGAVPQSGLDGVGPEGAAVDRAAVETEDIACLLFRTACGAGGTLMVSQVAAGRKNRLVIEIDGDRRSVAFDADEPDRLWIGAPEGASLLARDPLHLSAGARAYAVLPAGHAQGFHDCFEAFVRDVYRSIDSGSIVDGLPTFADGARAARIVEAVLASAAKHSWVEV